MSITNKNWSFSLSCIVKVKIWSFSYATCLFQLLLVCLDVHFYDIVKGEIINNSFWFLINNTYINVWHKPFILVVEWRAEGIWTSDIKMAKDLCELISFLMSSNLYLSCSYSTAQTFVYISSRTSSEIVHLFFQSPLSYLGVASSAICKWYFKALQEQICCKKNSIVILSEKDLDSP